MRGFFAGAIGLLLLHALVARANQNQLSGLARTATGLVTRFLDPSIPAIADHSTPASSGSGSAPPSSTAGGVAASSAAVLGAVKVYPAPTAR